MPDVHFPRPRKVVERVVDITPITVFSLNVVQPHPVHLHHATVMAVEFRVAVNDVEATALLPRFVQHVDQQVIGPPGSRRNRSQLGALGISRDERGRGGWCERRCCRGRSAGGGWCDGDGRDWERGWLNGGAGRASNYDNRRNDCECETHTEPPVKATEAHGRQCRVCYAFTSLVNRCVVCSQSHEMTL